MTARIPHVGDRVRVERDEQRYPSRGTWPQYRGRAGTVVSVNRARTVQVRDGAGSKAVKVSAEYGVSFSRGRSVDAWFGRHEITVAK
jgi:ribosomal protein L21E